MATKTLNEIPSSDIIIDSPHELDYIRKKLSALFINNVDIERSQLATLQLILRLANEIAELKMKLADTTIK